MSSLPDGQATPAWGVPGRLLAVNPVNHPGGAEVVLLRLLGGLAQRGWRVSATTPDAGPLAEAILAAGLHWTPLAVGGLAAGAGAEALLGWGPLRRLARDVDVVYLNGTVTGRMLPALAGRGVLSVLDVNDMVTRAPRLWRRADLILADSQAIATRLTDLDPQLDPLVLGVPIDLDPPSVADPWAGREGPVVGFMGRLEPRKGVHDLLSAVPAIRAGAAGAHVVLVGDEPFGTAPDYTAAMRAEAGRLGVELVGWVDNAPGLMRHLDVLVLPSRAEPFGTVLAEAMAVGTPVVASAVDGLVEVVADGLSGRLVPPGDPVALGAAVLEVLGRRAEMSAAAARHAQRWEAGAYVERVAGLLEQRIAETTGR